MKIWIAKKEIAGTLESSLLKMYEGFDSNLPSKKMKKFIAKISREMASEIRDLLKKQAKPDQKALRKDLKNAKKQTKKNLKKVKETKSTSSHSKEARGVSILI